MKKQLCRLGSLLCVMLLALGLWPASVAAADGPPEVEAGAYALIDAETGQVLCGKNLHQALYPASITKILTVALTLESAPDYGQMVEVSYRACHELIYGATHIALSEGELLPVGDLLYGTQIESANDGANALAEYNSGSIEGFAEVMNAKTAALGLTDSNFSNPSGQPAADHVTSAYDMAQITRWALGVPGFREIFSATSYTMSATNKRGTEFQFRNRNPIINPDHSLYYPGVTGSKMGYTDDARYTLVTSARRGDTELICVVMNCDTDTAKYASTISLLDYGFDSFSRQSLPAAQLEQFSVPVFGGGSEKLGDIDVEAAQDVSYLLHNSISPEAVQLSYSVPEDYVIGRDFAPSISLSLPGNTRVQDPAIVTVPMGWKGLDAIFAENTSVWQRAIVQYPAAVWFVALALALLLLGVLVRVMYVRHRRARRRRLRMEAALSTMPIRIAERPPAVPPAMQVRKGRGRPVARSSPAARKRPPARASFEVYDRRSTGDQRRVGRAR